MDIITLKTTQIIIASLEEDIASGDITTQAIIAEDSFGKANILFKENGILAGLPIIEKVFQILDEKTTFQALFSEGDFIPKGTIAATIEAPMSVLLEGERTALNFLQHLSAIATLTHQYVEAVKPHKVKILDTRKTTPLLRHFEKYAVRIGGGTNYRWGLYDVVMIKDNHIKAANGIGKAIERILKAYNTKYFITVEVSNLKQLKVILGYPVNRIMLDNMDTDTIREAIAIINGKFEIEVSGGITPQRARELAPLGIDYISSGALTNRCVSLDISMNFEN